MSAVTTAKKAFRKTVKQSLRGLDGEAIGRQSSIWTRTVTSLPEYKDASRISIYLSMPKGELQTNELVNDAFGRGKSIFVPYIHRLSASSPVITPAPSPQLSTLQSSQMDMLSLASPEDYASLPRDNWGIPSIPSTSVPERENCLTSNSSKQGGMGDQVFKGLDLVILPGVAFGMDGRRLGHGKGYYDTWLSKYWDAVGADSEARMPILVGTALTEQLFEEGKVPVDGTDWLVDMVVTGDGRVIRKVGDGKEDDRRK